MHPFPPPPTNLTSANANMTPKWPSYVSNPPPCQDGCCYLRKNLWLLPYLNIHLFHSAWLAPFAFIIHLSVFRRGSPNYGRRRKKARSWPLTRWNRVEYRCAAQLDIWRRTDTAELRPADDDSCVGLQGRLDDVRVRLW